MKFLQKIIPARYHYALANLKRKFTGYTTYSQCGEDMTLLEIFGDKLDGFYVDVGAHHPERYSNTYLLHKKGWQGINIDPDPNAIVLFNKARPNDQNVEIGVAPVKGTLSYFQFSDPAINSFVEKEAGRWMNKDWVTFLGTREIAVRPLADILHMHASGKQIDVLTVDAEGMGLDVLESNDWSQWVPSVIVVEDNVRDYLIGKGYSFFRQCGLSDIFILKNSGLNRANG